VVGLRIVAKLREYFFISGVNGVRQWHNLLLAMRRFSTRSQIEVKSTNVIYHFAKSMKSAYCLR